MEAIYSHEGYLIEDPKDIGTYHFCPSGNIFESIGHYVKDVKPWIRWGNSPDDTTTSWEEYMINKKYTKSVIVIAFTILLLVGVMAQILSNFYSRKIFQYIDEADYDKIEQTCKNPFTNVNIFSKNLGWLDAIVEKPAPTTLLQYACEKNDTQAAAILLKHGADPNKIHTRSKSTPISLASARGNLEMISLLIEHEADVTAENQALQGLFSALRYARYKGTLSLQDFQTMIKLFEQNGFDLSQTDKAGETILFQAARFADLEVSKYLIESREMTLSSVNQNGQTILHIVCKSAFSTEYKSEYVKYLIEKGIDVNIKDTWNKTAYDYAVENDFTEIVELLK